MPSAIANQSGRKRKRKRLSPAQQRRAEDHMHMVDRVVQCLHLKTSLVCDHDDLRQAGCLGLIQAARDYRPGHGKFSTYACHRIRGAVMDALRGYDRLKRSHRAAVKAGSAVDPQTHSLCTDEAETTPQAAQDKGEEAEACACRNEQTADICRVVRTVLTPLEHIVICQCYIRGMQAVDLAKIINVNQSRIAQVKSLALRKLREVVPLPGPDKKSDP